MHICTSFYKVEEVKKFKFKSIGSNVFIKKNVSFFFIENIQIGDNVRIDDNVIIVSNKKNKLIIGNNVHIASNCYLAGSDGIEIHDFCTLAPGVMIFSGSDDYSGIKLTNPTVGKPFIGGKFGKVVLNKHVIVGANSVILPDVKIGVGTSIGSLSLVNKSIGNWGIYAGIPVKRIKKRSKKMLILEKNFLKKNPHK